MTFLTAKENVRMSLELHDEFLNQDINAKAIAMLETVGLADRVNYYPENLIRGTKTTSCDRSCFSQPSQDCTSRRTHRRT